MERALVPNILASGGAAMILASVIMACFGSGSWWIAWFAGLFCLGAGAAVAIINSIA